jgi:hypothetical protein
MTIASGDEVRIEKQGNTNYFSILSLYYLVRYKNMFRTGGNVDRLELELYKFTSLKRNGYSVCWSTLHSACSVFTPSG